MTPPQSPRNVPILTNYAPIEEREWTFETDQVLKESPLNASRHNYDSRYEEVIDCSWLDADNNHSADWLEFLNLEATCSSPEPSSLPIKEPTLPNFDLFDFESWSLLDTCIVGIVVAGCVYGCYLLYRSSDGLVNWNGTSNPINPNPISTPDAHESILSIPYDYYSSIKHISKEALEWLYQIIVERIWLRILQLSLLLTTLIIPFVLRYLISIWRWSRMTSPVLQIELRFRLLDIQVWEEELGGERRKLEQLLEDQLRWHLPSSYEPSELTYTYYLLDANALTLKSLLSFKMGYLTLSNDLEGLPYRSYISTELFQRAVQLRLSEGNGRFNKQSYYYVLLFRRMVNLFNRFRW